jgi:hypothetical protein
MEPMPPRYASVCPDEPEFRVLVVHEEVVHRGDHKPPPLFSRKPYFDGFFGAPTAIGRESLLALRAKLNLGTCSGLSDAYSPPPRSHTPVVHKRLAASSLVSSTEAPEVGRLTTTMRAVGSPSWRWPKAISAIRGRDGSGCTVPAGSGRPPPFQTPQDQALRALCGLDPFSPA